VSVRAVLPRNRVWSAQLGSMNCVVGCQSGGPVGRARPAGERNISIARREAVAALDAFAGPKA
jgi:hypothetical protein